MKKSILKFLVASIAVASVSAGEWGGKFVNSTNFAGKSDDLKLTQKDSVSLWGKIPVSKDNASYLMGEVSYTFKYDDSENAKRQFNNIVDLTLLEGNFRFDISDNSRFLLRVGRFPISDGTNSIFTQLSDGLFASYKNYYVDLSLYGGYTGLLNAKNAEMILPSSVGISSEYSEADQDLYAFAPKYIPFGANLKIPFAAQNFVLQGWGFADVNGDDYNRYYGIVGFNGYISKFLSYNIVSAFGTEKFDTISNFSKADLSIYSENLLAGLSGVFATGTIGNFSPFTGVTKQTAVYAKRNAEYTSLVKGGVFVNYLINKTVNLSGAFDVVMTADDDTVEYRGIQYRAGVDWNVFRDLRLGGAVKQFIGDNSDDDKLSLDLTLTFAF